MKSWWWFNNEFRTLIFGGQKGHQQQQQQEESETAAKEDFAHSDNPPSYESVAHQAKSTGGIQINHTDKGAQVNAGSRRIYAESVSESSVTEDFDENDAATEGYEWETEDTDDAVSHWKNSASPTSSESTIHRFKPSAGIQNNNTGNGTQFNTFSQGNAYSLNSGSGRQYQRTECAMLFTI